MIQLMEGDCLDVMREMEDNSVDVLITDPPYGLNEWVGRKKGRSRLAIASEWGSQAWDDKIPDREYFEQMIRVSKNQVIFGGNYFAHLLPPSPAWLVWDKDNTGNFADIEMAWTSYESYFDDLGFALLAFRNDMEPVCTAWSSFKTSARKFKYRWNGMLQGAIGDRRLNEKRIHPTQKPLPLMEWVVVNYSKEGDLIFDPFMGSGTTGKASVKHGRNFKGCEKEKIFYDISVSEIKAADAQITF